MSTPDFVPATRPGMHAITALPRVDQRVTGRDSAVSSESAQAGKRGSLRSTTRRADSAGPRTGPAPDHSHVLIVTDFVSTCEEFHRRLIWVGRLIGTNVSLLQLPDGGAAVEADAASAILLEGLRRRLRIPPEACSIVPTGPIDRVVRNRRLQDVDLVLFGRSHGGAETPAHLEFLERVRSSGFEVLTIDDRPEWDWSR